MLSVSFEEHVMAESKARLYEDKKRLSEMRLEVSRQMVMAKNLLYYLSHQFLSQGGPDMISISQLSSPVKILFCLFMQDLPSVHLDLTLGRPQTPEE
ncbi:hypothetical protein P7K49_015053 [Saguinus oedipus]|uniref:Uncharacterized protein n=1 Tax=Saguinus oedipus TaxID=9490 RepID=A0ABQ9V845_SAGOE|nr:hypothetical protein P7K49_015053 [Saguinus oedipus]